jgi:hypothetical protein
MDDLGRNGRNSAGACYDTHAILREYKSFFEKALYLTGCAFGIGRERSRITLQLVLLSNGRFSVWW